MHIYFKLPGEVPWKQGKATHFCQRINTSLSALNFCWIVALFCRDIEPIRGHIDCLSGGEMGVGEIMFVASEIFDKLNLP